MNNKVLINHLLQFLGQERKNRLTEVLENRTRHITVVLEDIYQEHNASAVLRSCDCFGIQDIYTIENINKYTLSRKVTMGSDKWLDIHSYNSHENNTKACIHHLKQQGYTIVATTPHKNDFELESFPIDNKIALLFGTELKGLSQEALCMADKHLRIPMFGFTESFNISVSAALCLHNLTYRLRNSDIQWQLTQDEKEEIYFDWIKKAVKKSDVILEKFMANNASELI